MADYKGIQGYSVQSLASDPTVANVVGQLWYNSASNVWKVSVQGAGAWSAGGTMTRTVAQGNIGGCGSLTASVVSGGYGPPSPGISALSETYNGSAWTATNGLNDARAEVAMAGTTTAAIGIGGSTTAPEYMDPSCEEYDGTSWTEVTAITTARGTGSGCGVQTAALFATGNTGGLTTPAWQDLGNTEEWNGSAWSEKADVNTPRNYLCQINAGTVTAALAVDGHTSTTVKNCETYNGTTWTEVNDTNTDRGNGGGFGTSTTAMAFGGEPPAGVTANAEQWNGTCWTEVANLAAANYNPGGSGSTGTSGIKLAGALVAPGGPTSTCEEWDGAPIAAKTVTTS